MRFTILNEVLSFNTSLSGSFTVITDGTWPQTGISTSKVRRLGNSTQHAQRAETQNSK